MKNPNQITFTIGEETIHMVFNNSSRNALSQALFGDQSKANDIQALLEKLNEVNAENYWFAAKVVIYSGVVGYYMESDQPRPKYTFKEIGEVIGKMTEAELMEYTLKVWEKFWDDYGVNLKQLVESESDPTEVKKK